MLKNKILILGKLPPPFYGPAVATQIILASSLKDHFSVFHSNTSLNKKIKGIGKFEFLKSIKVAFLYFQFIQRILKIKPSLILVPISQSTMGFVKDSIYILISKLFLCPVLLQLRGSNFKNWFASSSKLTQTYTCFVLKCTKAVIVLGDNLRYLFKEFYTDDRIFVVPNGANYSFLSSKNTSEIIKILYFSNLQPSKGIEDVIEAILFLKENYKLEFILDIVGSWRDANTKNHSFELFSKYNLPINFHPSAHGEVKNEFFQNADIFIFPPRKPEGHPWVIIEAMAAGLPIISTDQGAITESVIDRVNGFIVDKQNPEQIADKIKFMIENPEIRKKMGNASRKHYLQNFTEEKMVEKLTYCFNKVLDK